MRQRGTPNRRHACGRDITGLRRGYFKGDQSPLSNPLVSDGEQNHPGRQSPELSVATQPRFRAAAVGNEVNRKFVPSEAREQKKGAAIAAPLFNTFIPLPLPPWR